MHLGVASHTAITRCDGAKPAAVLRGVFHEKQINVVSLAEAMKFVALVDDDEAAGTLERGYAEAGYEGAMWLAAGKLAARSGVACVPVLATARRYAHAGEKDRALDSLEKAFPQHEIPLVHLNLSWDWCSLRGDPRFRNLPRSRNFPP